MTFANVELSHRIARVADVMREHFGMTPMDMYEIHKMVHREGRSFEELPEGIKSKVLEAEKIASGS